VAISANLPDEERDVARADELASRLASERLRAAAEGDSLDEGAMIRAAALLSAAFQRADEESLWRADADVSTKLGQPLEPVTAVEIARYEAPYGVERLSGALLSIQNSIEWYYGSISLRPETITALEFLDRRFDRLMETLVDLKYTPYVLQLVATLRRNALSKAINFKRLSHEGRVSFPIASPHDCCPIVAQGLCDFVVLEWIDVQQGAFGLISTITGNSARVEVVSVPPDLPLYQIADSISARLLGWRVGRKGEPFQVSEWPIVVDWLCSLVQPRLPSGGHLVIIDHARFSAIPYHIALAPRWTVSYAADWSAVVDAARAALNRPVVANIGVTYCPRSNESESSLAAFSKSVERTRQFAMSKGLSSSFVIGIDSDASALEKMLSSVTIAKIICHGQVSRENADVELLVSYERTLPPGYTFASAVKLVEKHRVGWREFSRFAAAPTLLFLGACSSGKVQILGLDERISIFSSLQKVGTSAIVSPRWKIDVEFALPVLDDIIEAYVNGVPLVSAITSAAEA
jgi:hypothetical protein